MQHKEEIKKIYVENKEKVNQNKKNGEKINAINSKLDTLFNKINKFKESKLENSTEVNRLRGLRTSIKDEILLLEKEEGALVDEYYNKKYEFETQQQLIDYIKQAEKKKADLKKWEEKKKKEGANEPTNTEPTTIKFENYYTREIDDCEWLISNFKAILNPESIATKVEVEESNIVDHRNKDTEHILGVSDEYKKKKGKAPKESNRAQNKVEVLALEYTVVEKLKRLELAPPVYRKDLPYSIVALQEKIDQFLKMREKNEVIKVRPEDLNEKVEIKEKEKKEVENDDLSKQLKANL